jgi:hypothetical protein
MKSTSNKYWNTSAKRAHIVAIGMPMVCRKVRSSCTIIMLSIKKDQHFAKYIFWRIFGIPYISMNLTLRIPDTLKSFSHMDLYLNIYNEDPLIKHIVRQKRRFHLFNCQTFQHSSNHQIVHYLVI